MDPSNHHITPMTQELPYLIPPMVMVNVNVTFILEFVSTYPTFPELGNVHFPHLFEGDSVKIALICAGVGFVPCLTSLSMFFPLTHSGGNVLRYSTSAISLTRLAIGSLLQAYNPALEKELYSIIQKAPSASWQTSTVNTASGK